MHGPCQTAGQTAIYKPPTTIAFGPQLDEADCNLHSTKSAIPPFEKT